MLILLFTLPVRAQENAVDSPAIQPVPEVIYYPFDTAALIKQLDFKPFNYDSILAEKEAPTRLANPATLHLQQRDLVLPIVGLLMLLYVTWIRYIFHRELKENITVISNSNLGQQIYRDREFSANIFKFVTFLNFAISIGVFMFLVMRHYQLPMPFKSSGYTILACVIGFSLLYVIKGWAYRIIGSVFRISNALQFFRFNALVIYHLLGIILLPFLLLAAFSDPPVNTYALKGALALVVIALLIRMVKGLVAAGLTGRLHILYFLLYICGLEVAPVLITIRLFNMWAGA